jgi:G:T/U-mismatch repair DNA glycosylase
VNEEYTIEIHPDWDFDIPEMKTLILGNFPPHKKRWDYEFFYPNKQNNFWRVLAAINGKPLKEISGWPAVKERKAIMKDLKTGVMNIAAKIKRKGHSARDTDIEIIEYNDVLNVILKHPELETIIIAGYSARNSTAVKFIEYLNSQNIEYEPPTKIKAGGNLIISIGGKKIKCVIVNSTSTAFPIKLDDLVSQFKPYIKAE